MKLLNFCIGQVQTVQIGGEPIKTAHMKAPVEEPWIIDVNGAAGDKRAIHPDKIYAFARSAYDYWGRYFNVDPARWPDGFFGENLTLDVLDEQDVRIGDEFTIGDEVRLVVAGARTPCSKLAWRLGQPRTFQKTFAKSRRTGVYMGVLNTGRVRPGDEVRRIRHDPTMPSVADICDFAAGHTTPPLEPIKRLLAFEHLSPTIRLLLTSKLESAERAVDAAEGRWRGWRAFVIEEIVEEAPDIRSFRVAPADGEKICQPKPGQFVTVRMEGEGENIERCWSVSEYGQNGGGYRLTVKRQDGPGSNWMHQAAVGAKLKLRAPSGNFILDMGGFRPVVLVAAGIGVTPILAMLQAHLSRGAIGAPVHLIYGGRSPEDMAFRDQLQKLADRHAHFHLHYVYSQSQAGQRPAQRITSELLLDILADLHVVLDDGTRIPLPWFETDTYICGPGDFCALIKDALAARGANADRIFYELFTAVETGDAVDEAEVRFAKSGVTCAWDAAEDLTLLELAERAGLDLESECRAGACLTCQQKILDGETTAAIDNGSTLMCIGRPASHRLVIDC